MTSALYRAFLIGSLRLNERGQIALTQVHVSHRPTHMNYARASVLRVKKEDVTEFDLLESPEFNDFEEAKLWIEGAYKGRFPKLASALSITESSDVASQAKAQAPSKPKCRECGGTDLEWQCMQSNRGGAVNGRLRLNEVSTVFVLSCTECSEDVRRVSGDDVAAWMTTAKLSPEVAT